MTVRISNEGVAFLTAKRLHSSSPAIIQRTGCGPLNTVGFVANLLTATGKKHGWTLIAEERIKIKGKTVIPDGTFRDQYEMHRGHWEAKDTGDDLEAEIKKKIATGYPLGNIIFEDTRLGHLFQNGKQAMRADLTDPQQLCDLLNAGTNHNQARRADSQ